jgi:hypothetical protein
LCCKPFLSIRLRQFIEGFERILPAKNERFTVLFETGEEIR